MRIILILSFLLISSLVLADDAGPTDNLSWQRIKIKVASLSDLDKRFSKSVHIFTQGEKDYSDIDYEFIEGTASAEIKGIETVHITGNLDTNIYLKPYSELIIGGDATKNSRIFVSDMTQIFIAGDFHGLIVAKGSMQTTILGNFTGMVKTGDPHADLVVHGNLSGIIEPNNDSGSLLSIRVFGFTDSKIIETIFSHKYTKLNCAFTTSNIKPGIYQPEPPYRNYYVVEYNLN